MAGQILGDRYQVERELGKHAGRWTLLVHDLHAKERVVVKLLCSDEDLQSDALKLFDREVETLKSLSHPCIPKYLGYFQHWLPGGRALALVQTYVAGRSLSDCLSRGRRFNEAEAKQIAKSVLYILIYLQERNPSIVHRDIKPSNILLGDRKIHLVDFGSVKIILNRQDGISDFTIVNTHDFTPPEQYSGRAVTASDLYSLGLTIMTSVTGIQPSQLPRKGNRFDLESVVDLSPAFIDWLQWMTETTIEHRLQSAMMALQALDAAQVRSAIAS
ncbi:MAG: serine/threonine protein kinase [Plectolyngbya sp. WJT66-NPBG17]|jgi:serine/threonine protein kinase|nr:serine/threonine protein kinase [Plectolyngbya sp. WJT66-NPBG17]MBW4525313.1 serine/threonine protein kinase [Phormidium tanganyikae FI6-MK23]